MKLSEIFLERDDRNRGTRLALDLFTFFAISCFSFKISGIGFGYTCHRLISNGEKGVSDIFLDAADLITIVIPPALPAAMTIGKV